MAQSAERKKREEIVPKFSAAIITYNEESNIERCLKAIQWIDEIVIVDACSSDKTVELCKKYTDKIYFNEFKDFSAQKNFALSKCSHDWVLFIDADEEVSGELKEKLRSLDVGSKAGYKVRRKTFMFKRLMKYGGHSLDAPLRIFDKNRGKFIQPIHEFFKIEGPVGFISEPIMHYSCADIKEHVEKINFYTDLEVHFLSERKVNFCFIKFIFVPVARFLQRYILQRGFLDGREGFIFYVKSGVYDFVKWFKYWDYSRKRQK